MQIPPLCTNCQTKPEHRSPLSRRVAFNVYPGLRHPTSQSDSTELAEVLRRGWLFGVTYHNTRGAIASATAAWAILFDRSAVARKRPKSRELANQLQERLPEALFEKLSGSLSIDTVVLGGPVPSYLASAA